MTHLTPVPDPDYPTCAICGTRTDQVEYAWESGLSTPVWDGPDGNVIMSKTGSSTFCSETHWAEWTIAKLQRLGHLPRGGVQE